MGEDKGWESGRKGKGSYWRRNRKDQDVNKENYNTFLNISQSKKDQRKEARKKRREGGRLDPLSPRLYIYFEPYTFAQRQRVGVSSRFGLNSVIDVIVFRFLFWCGIWSGYWDAIFFSFFFCLSQKVCLD